MHLSQGPQEHRESDDYCVPETGGVGPLLMRRYFNLVLKDEYKFSRWDPGEAKARVFSLGEAKPEGWGRTTGEFLSLLCIHVCGHRQFGPWGVRQPGHKDFSLIMAESWRDFASEGEMAEFLVTYFANSSQHIDGKPPQSSLSSTIFAVKKSKTLSTVS